MTDVGFYHIQKVSLEPVLLKLLQKSLSAGKRSLVLVDSAERVQNLDLLLWNYEPASWLPHGASHDEYPEEQPILLSTEDENLNHSHFLFLLEGMKTSNLAEYERCFILFEGRFEGAVNTARTHWINYEKAGHQLTYWQQSDDGTWAKK